MRQEQADPDADGRGEGERQSRYDVRDAGDDSGDHEAEQRIAAEREARARALQPDTEGRVLRQAAAEQVLHALLPVLPVAAADRGGEIGFGASRRPDADAVQADTLPLGVPVRTDGRDEKCGDRREYAAEDGDRDRI